MSPTHFQVVNALEWVYQYCGEFAITPSKGKTLIFYGPNGVGKSHILKRVHRWAVANSKQMPLVHDELSEQRNVSLPTCEYRLWADLLALLKKGEWQIVEDLIATTLLILDDIGAEHDPSGVGLEKLYTVLSHREFKWTMISTNITPAHWSDKFEKRIASRLFRNAVHVDMSQVPDFSTT